MSVPHLAFPVRFDRGRAAVVEQDTPDDIAACVALAFRTPRGFYDDTPRFGVEEPTFQPVPLDLDTLTGDVEASEPRVRAAATEQPDRLNAAWRRITLDLEV